MCWKDWTGSAVAAVFTGAGGLSVNNAQLFATAWKHECVWEKMGKKFQHDE